MNKTTLIAILIALVAIGAVVFSRSQAPAIQTGDIQLGAILNLTGTFADQGENSRNGITLALEEINKTGVMGRKVSVDYQDNQGDNPKGALDALNNLANKDIRLIIGPNLTPSANVVGPVLEKMDVVMVSPSVGSEKFAESSPRAFNVFPPNKFDSFALAEYIFDKGIRKIAIFGSQQEWEMEQAQFVKQKFEELGGTVSSIQLPTVDNRDLRAESSKIKDSDPEAVVFTNYGETAIAARRLKSLGVNAPFYSVLLYDPQIQQAMGALEGTVFVTTDTVNKEWDDTYKARFRKEPGITAIQAYDATNLMVKAIELARSTDTNAVTKALVSIKSYKGASGDLTFDSDGNAHKPQHFYQVKNDKIIPL